MANKFNKHLKFDPTSNKGNLADFQHASRLYLDDYFRLAPKHKFLYHVVFQINPGANILSDYGQKHKNEINMLVKNVDLPKYTISVDTKQQYNRKKNYHSKINYEPVNIVFHDDNDNVTTRLWESYYKYYFTDSRHGEVDNAGNIVTNPSSYSQNAYAGPALNKYNYGLDSGSTVPFFTAIQIFQLSRQKYTCFTLVNPVITAWNHDNMDYSDAAGVAENSCTVQYESVFYSTGEVQEGIPRGFAEPQHYDVTPSPLVTDGSNNGQTSGITDIYGNVGRNTSQNNFARPGANFIGQTKELTTQGLVSNGFNIGNIANGTAPVSNVNNTVFPKNSGNGSASLPVFTSSGFTTTNQTVINNQETATVLNDNPNQKSDLAKNTVFRKSQINSGFSGDLNAINQKWEALPQSEKDTYINQVST